MGVKISNLPFSNLPLSGNELLPLVQGSTVKSSLSSLLTYLSGSLLTNSELAALSSNFALKNTTNFFTDSQNITGSSVNLTVGNNHSNGGIVSVILGGTTNTTSDLISNAVTVGGSTNRVTGSNSSIVGGNSNSIFAERSSIIGGSFNTTGGQNSSVIGGTISTALSLNSIVMGGTINVASGLGSSVMGGSFNTASNKNSSVVGGQSNTSSSDGSIVLGGINNSATATASIVLGGEQNTSSGEDSVSSGFGAVAYAKGMHATSNGFFASPGDAQSIHIPLIGALTYDTGTALSAKYTGSLVTRLNPSTTWTLRQNTVAVGTIQVAVVAANSQLFAFDFNFATHTINGNINPEFPSITSYLNNRFFADTPRFPRFIIPIPSTILPVSVVVNPSTYEVSINLQLALTGANVAGQRANEAGPLRCVANLTGVEYLPGGSYY